MLIGASSDNGRRISCGRSTGIRPIVTIRHPSARSARHCNIARLPAVVPETGGARWISVGPAHARLWSCARPRGRCCCGHHADRSSCGNRAASRPTIVGGTRPADTAAMRARTCYAAADRRPAMINAASRSNGGSRPHSATTSHRDRCGQVFCFADDREEADRGKSRSARLGVNSSDGGERDCCKANCAKPDAGRSHTHTILLLLGDEHYF
jgi:hypothetical protein